MKTIEIVDQTIPYKTRVKMRRKTLTFRERHFTVDEGVLPFLYFSYKMWATKIYGGFRELLFGKAKKK